MDAILRDVTVVDTALIVDSVHARALPLLMRIAKSAPDACIVCCDRQADQLREECPNAAYVESLRESPKASADEMVAQIAAVTNGKPGPIFIESLSTLIYRASLPVVIRLLTLLSTRRDAGPVVCLLHGDCHSEKVVASVRYMFSTTITAIKAFYSTPTHPGYSLACSLIHKPRGNGTTVIRSTELVSSSGVTPYVDETASEGSAAAASAPSTSKANVRTIPKAGAAPTDIESAAVVTPKDLVSGLTTFNISMSDKDRAARDAITMPYEYSKESDAPAVVIHRNDQDVEEEDEDLDSDLVF